LRKEGDMKKKLKILAIVTVMAALISLGGSQVLSRGPGFKPNYDAEFTGHIEGGGPVEWRRTYSISSDGYTYTLVFSGEGGFWVDDFGKDFVGPHDEGWLAMLVDKQSGRALFEYRWSDDMGNNYDLSGHGEFESSKKKGSFTFTSDGEMYTLVQW
jgi:hypothetical protein